jgi:hypothetical protein
MTRHFGVATIYHRGCIYHPSRGCIYHRGGDFAIAVAMTRAMVISNRLQIGLQERARRRLWFKQPSMLLLFGEVCAVLA